VKEPFAVLTEDDRRRLHSVMRRRRFRRHEVVCHQGDPGDSLHVVVKGRFVATVTSASTGLTAAVNLFGPDSIFGELALLDGSARSATITAVEPAETLELKRPDFEALLGEHPAVERFLLLALAGLVRTMTDQITEALFDPVDTRLCRRVLLLNELAAASDQRWITLRQEDLAILAGTTRSTVNRLLRRLEADGVIELRRGGVGVLDPVRLRRLAR
jgi:CRP/FNR family transcriptional regulator, cyclic AMP receptor protein